MSSRFKQIIWITGTLRKRLIYTGNCKSNKVSLCALAILLCWLVTAAAAVDTKEKLMGDISDGSRAVPVHFINILDEEGKKISPADQPVLPFSTRKSCGECHDYGKISKGWHFNAADANVPCGKSGQPWIYVDASSGIQIPLSYRSWPGTFKPGEVGITSWKFTQLFGRQMPGGGAGEIESENPEEIVRGFVSGKLEINCLSCHDGDSGHNQAEYSNQIARQNFRWAATATCGFASVGGSARDMPDTYDPLMPSGVENTARCPAVVYRENTFDHKGRVLFNIVREVPNERCYFCHSTAKINGEKWQTDEDVHLASGMNCVDCHRNGLEHNITRGYEGEELISMNPLASVSSCKGCHLGGEGTSIPEAGRLGAPVPKHWGIPAVHFDKLACTACHAGNWPEEKTGRIKTSQGHGLGIYNVNKSAEVLPHIVSGVFAKMADGKIASCNLIWPAFWGGLKDGKVAPINPEIAKPIVSKIVVDDKAVSTGDWPNFTEEQVARVLAMLASEKAAAGEAVYISGGKLHRLGDKGKLIVAEHEAAEPYLWDNVSIRPAAQSLGVNGCGDCHAKDKPFFFGEVAVDSPIASERSFVKMIKFEGVDPVYTKAFALSFVVFKWVMVISIVSCVVLAAVLVLYAFFGLARVLKMITGKS